MQFEMRNRTGNGTGSTESTAETTRTPIAVIVKSASTRHPHYRITGMSNSQRVLHTATSTTAITGFGAGSYTIGSDTDVNTNLENYVDLVLFDDGNSHVAVGSYTGDGGGSKSIATGLGALENVIVFQNAAATAYWHPLSLGGTTDASFSLGTGIAAAGYITDISTTTGTFVVGTSLNASSTTYYYIAFATVAGAIMSTSYSGNSTDNRSLDVDSSNGGRTVQFAMCSNNTTAARASTWRGETTAGHSGDQYSTWSSDSFGTNRLQAFGTETVTLGDNLDVNSSSNTYHIFWMTNYTPSGGSVTSRTLSESVTATDAENDVRENIRVAIETITVSDAEAREAIRVRYGYDYVLAYDSLFSAYALNRVLSEANTVSDSLAAQIYLGGQIITLRSLLDTIQAYDSSVLVKQFMRNVGDIVVTGDSLLGVRARNVEVGDVAVVTDNIDRRAFLARLLTDLASISDSILSEIPTQIIELVKIVSKIAQEPIVFGVQPELYGMSKHSILKFNVGDTLKLSWINSGVTPTTLTGALIDNAETVISSVSMTSSGDGQYYSRHTLPSTPGFYVFESRAVINGYPYTRRSKVQAVMGDTD